MSVASPHLTDLESPLERNTLRVERAMSDPVELLFGPLAVFFLFEYRDIFIP